MTTGLGGEDRARVTFALTGGRVVRVHGRLLEADTGGEALHKASPCSLSVWHGRHPESALLPTHKNGRLRLLAGQRVNNHIAKSTEMLNRVLTGFERCQLCLILTRAGPGWAGRGGGLLLRQENAQKLGIACSHSGKRKHPK